MAANVEENKKKLTVSLDNTAQALEGFEKVVGAAENELNLNGSKQLTVEGSYSHELKIPDSWVFSELKNVIEIVGGSQPPKSEFNSESGEGLIRLIQIRDYKSDKHIVYIPKEKARRFVSKTEIMIGRYGPPIFQILRGLEGAYNVALMKAIPVQKCMTNEYLFYYLSGRDIYNYVESASDRTAGQSGVNKAHLEKYPVGLPPLAEQTIIAQTLDALLAQVDNIKTRLDTIPKILKTFRQSVLAAAVSGKLTEEWRGNVAAYDEVTGWYLAKDWTAEEFKSLAKFIDYRGRTPKKVGAGTPLITAKNIKDGYINREPREYISNEDYEPWMTRGIPRVKDVLITTEAPLGNVALIDIQEKFALAQRAICLQFHYVEFGPCMAVFMRSLSFKEKLLAEATGTTVKGIKASKLKLIGLPIPPLEEQTQIVSRVEELFAFADQIEQQVKNAQGRVNNLTQSILAKAFRGELTTQWRKDNPDKITGENSAEALLAKIQEEREALKKSAKPKKAPKKKATSSKKSESTKDADAVKKPKAVVQAVTATARQSKQQTTRKTSADNVQAVKAINIPETDIQWWAFIRSHYKKSNPDLTLDELMVHLVQALQIKRLSPQRKALLEQVIKKACKWQVLYKESGVYCLYEVQFADYDNEALDILLPKLLRKGSGIPQDDLYKSYLQALGFKRGSPKAEQRFKSYLRSALIRKVLQRDGDELKRI